MTGDEEFGGVFGHLDDPTAPAPTADTLGSVVQRGRHIRARRRSLFAASGAAAALVVVVGGIGVSRALDASADHDSVIPAVTGSATPDPTRTPRKHASGDDADVVSPAALPDAGLHRPGGKATSPAPAPCDSPDPSLSPAASLTDVDPLASPSEPAVAPSPTAGCPTATVSPDLSATASPTDTAQPSPTGTASPSEVASGG